MGMIQLSRAQSFFFSALWMSWEGLLIKRFEAQGSAKKICFLAGLALPRQVSTKQGANQTEKKAVEF
jgi:hypothetical protein